MSAKYRFYQLLIWALSASADTYHTFQVLQPQPSSATTTTPNANAQKWSFSRDAVIVIPRPTSVTFPYSSYEAFATLAPLGGPIKIGYLYGKQLSWRRGVVAQTTGSFLHALRRVMIISVRFLPVVSYCSGFEKKCDTVGQLISIQLFCRYLSSHNQWEGALFINIPAISSS